MSRHVLCVPWMVSLVLVACEREPLVLEQPREEVRAIWDPSAPRLPTPTDLVRDSASGRLALPAGPEVASALTPAELEWRQWLNTLDGYPTSATLSFPLSGTLRENQNLAANVLLLRADAPEELVPVQASFDPESLTLTASPLSTESGQPVGFAPGQTYHYALWGYAEGLEAVPGAQSNASNEVIADAPFHLVKASEPLTDYPELFPGGTFEEQVQAAEQLEEIRLSMQDILPRFTRFGLSPQEIAVAGSMTTSSAQTIWNDANTGKVPLPSNLLLDEDQEHVALPILESDPPETAHIKHVLNHYDGFSTRGAIRFEATAEVDPTTALDPANHRLFRYDAQTGELTEELELERGVLDDGRTVYMRPRLALEPDTLYLHVATSDITTRETSQRLRPQPLSALLMFQSSLLDEAQRSAVSTLSDEQARRLEPLRAEQRLLLDALSSQYGVKRGDLALATTFRTVDALGFLMAHRAELYEQEVRTDVVNIVDRSPSERGLPIILRDVETIITGELTVRDHIDRKTLRFREDGQAEERLVSFVLTIPEGAKKGVPIPTVIFGHGLATSRELLYLIAQKLAEAGYAAITLDLPLHGERSVCLRDSSCAGSNATCDEDRRCKNADGTPGQLNRIDSPFPDGPSYPVTSGEPFIIIDDIEASRDHFVQAVMDMSQLVRVVKQADWATATGGYLLDGDDLMYLGMSLGGILGSILSVVEPSIDTYVLNVPGAGLLQMMENSAAFSSLYQQELDRRDITSRDSDAYFQFQNILYWMLDPIDPINVVQHTVRIPATSTNPETGELETLPFKRVQIQMAENDSVVPNITTEILSERMGVDYRRYTPTISNHAFLFDPTSGEGRRAREDMITFFEGRRR